MRDLLTSDELNRLATVSRGFYQRPTTDVARDLLGTVLVRRAEDGTAAVRITEVEAYLGVDDPACHTYGGRRTPRTETMWGAAGHAYVYLVYGLHCCLNVVTVGEGHPEAVLIRGGTPIAGVDLMRTRRGPSIGDRSLTDGPGKLCQALSVTRDDDGVDLSRARSGLVICSARSRCAGALKTMPRVGVEYAGEAAGWPLRYVLDDAG